MASCQISLIEIKGVMEARHFQLTVKLPVKSHYESPVFTLSFHPHTILKIVTSFLPLILLYGRLLITRWVMICL